MASTSCSWQALLKHWLELGKPLKKLHVFAPITSGDVNQDFLAVGLRPSWGHAENVDFQGLIEHLEPVYMLPDQHLSGMNVCGR